MRDEYCLARRVAPSLARSWKNGSVLRRETGPARVTVYERPQWPHGWALSNGRSAWRFIALTSVAVVAICAGAAVLLSLELTFEPAMLLSLGPSGPDLALGLPADQ